MGVGKISSGEEDRNFGEEKSRFKNIGVGKISSCRKLYTALRVGMAGKGGSLLEGALPDLVLEMGYHFTSSVQECRASLIKFQERSHN